VNSVPWSTYRQSLESDVDRISAITADQLSLDVAHLDGWTVRSVVGHTGWVLRFAAASLTSTPENPPARAAVPEPPPGDEVINWFGESWGLADAALESLSGEEARPTWTGPQPASWWLRRLAIEVAIHRWDAESAWMTPTPVDGPLAVDGIDEILEVFTPNRMQFSTLNGSGETVHLHSTDEREGEWFMTYGPDSVEWERSHTKGDVAARGTASDLLLLLWGRVPPAKVEIIGDGSLIDRWQSAATF